MTIAKRGLGRVGVWIALAVWVGVAGIAGAQTLVKIRDATTPAPGGGSFTTWWPPQVSEGNVVYSGEGVNGPGQFFWGVFRFDPVTGAHSTVRRQDSSQQPIFGLPPFGVSGPDVAYFDLTLNRLYSTRGGAIHPVEGVHPSMGTFTFPVRMDQTGYAYYILPPGEPDNAVARTDDNGTTTVVTAPGGFEKFLLRDGRVVYGTMNRDHPVVISSSAGRFEFSESDGRGGPDRRANFALPGEPAVPPGNPPAAVYGRGPESINPLMWNDDGNAVVFRATNAARTRTGLFTQSGAGGVLRTVADTNTIAPGIDGGAARFISFHDVAIDGNNVAFVASYGERQFGVFAETDGKLYEILHTGDLLDGGKAFFNAQMSEDRALSGNDLVLSVSFESGGSGDYLIRLPEPGGVGLIVAVATLLLPRPRRRRGVGGVVVVRAYPPRRDICALP